MSCTILITRPEPSAAEFAERVRRRLGNEPSVLVSPLMQIEYVRDPVLHLSKYKTLLFTSRHAVLAFSNLYQDRHFLCYCVGPSTTQEARAAGFDAQEGGGTVTGLATTIIAENPPGPCLYLRGENIADDLAEKLNSAGIETDEVILYRQTRQQLSPVARRVLHGRLPVIVPLFSVRSAKFFFAENTDAPIHVAAISDAVASAVPRSADTIVRVAASPTADAVLELIEEFVSSA